MPRDAESAWWAARAGGEGGDVAARLDALGATLRVHAFDDDAAERALVVVGHPRLLRAFVEPSPRRTAAAPTRAAAAAAARFEPARRAC